MSSSERYGRIFHAKDEPPGNELPVVLATPGVTWRGDGIVFAIPSLLAYTTGAELLIMYRTRHRQPRDIEHARATGEALQNLKANGIPVTLLGGQHYDLGFTYRAWAPFAWDGRDLIPGGDLTLELGWPEVQPAEHRVPGIRETSGRAVILWQPD
jgi:hypothetical protein